MLDSHLSRTVCARHQWLISVILATWEAEIRRTEASLGKQFARPYLKNTPDQKELVEWLKWQSTCLASMRPSSTPSTAKKKKKKKSSLYTFTGSLAIYKMSYNFTSIYSGGAKARIISLT
jgi:hypothetical protein